MVSLIAGRFRCVSAKAIVVSMIHSEIMIAGILKDNRSKDVTQMIRDMGKVMNNK